MNTTTKPDFTASKKIINEIQSIDQNLGKIISDETQYIQEIKGCMDSMRRATIAKTLEGTGIDQVNVDKNGIRVSALKAAGIHNIQQVMELSVNRLTAIDGIGPQTAFKVKEIANNIYRNLERTIQLRIDPEHPSPDSIKLTKNLYILHQSNAFLAECHRLYDTNHEAIQINIHTSKAAQSRWSWLFSFKSTKEKAHSAIHELEGLLQGEMKEKAENIGKEISRIIRDSETSSWTAFEKNAAPFYAVLESIVGSKLDKGVDRGGLSEELVQKVEAYDLDLSLMKTTLRSYQRFGAKYVLCQRNTLLGDEMGLGKTVQSIAAMADLTTKGKSHFLVVCPASLLINWTREIVQHSTLKVFKAYGVDRDEVFKVWTDRGGVAVTTYETLSKLYVIRELRVDLLIVDEAHYVKNPEAMRTQHLLVMAKLSERILFMTGTPLENRVDEMQFLVKCLQPKIAASIDQIRHLASAPVFRERIAPVYLRRTRENVLTELPDLLEKEEWCSLNDLEKVAYRNALYSRNFMQIRQLSWQITDVHSSTKAKRLMEICEEAKQNNRRIVVFSFFREVINKVCCIFGDQCMEPITGSVMPSRRQEIIDEFSESEPGTVLVCQVTAGGVGLNIQAASIVVFCEPQIKPSIENQAISRAYRMGQTQKVTVHRLLIEDSIDERIMGLLKMKQDIFDHFAHESAVADANKKMNESDWMNHAIQEECKRYGVQ